MQRYSPELDRIKQMLRQNRRGLSITDISRKIGVNRNSVAKYLDVLLISGDVEVKKVCTAKLYFLSERVPLTEMLSLTSDAILVLNSGGAIDFANQRFLSIEGYELNEIAGNPLSAISFTLIDEEMMDKVSSTSPGEIFEKEIHVDTMDGSQTFRTKCIGTVLPDGGSATTLIFEDITQKRECQARLRMKEELYRAVVEDQTEFIIRYRPDRTITFVNDAYCRVFGIDRLEVVGTVFAPSIPRKYKKMVSDQLSALTPDEPVVEFANPVIMADGNEVWHQWTNRGIFNDDGVLNGYQSVGRDITEQMDIQKGMTSLLEELTVLSDFSGDLVMLSEDDNVCSYAAENLRKIVPSSLIMLLSFRDDYYRFHEILSGKKWRNKNLASALFNVKWAGFSCSSETAESLSPMNLERLSGDFCSLLGQAFEGDAGNLFEEVVNRYDVYSMGIRSGNGLLGTCIFVTGKPIEPRSVRLIETIINQTAVVIQNRNMLKSMRLTEKRYESLLDNSLSMIGIHGGGKIVYANQRLRQYLGFALDEDLEKHPITDLIHPDDLEFVRQRMIKVYSEGEAAPPMKERLLDVNGDAKEVLVFSLPTVYRGKLGCQFIVQPLMQNEDSDQSC